MALNKMLSDARDYEGNARKSLDARLKAMGITKMGHRCGVMAAWPELRASSRSERLERLKAVGLSKLGHRLGVLNLLDELNGAETCTRATAEAGAASGSGPTGGAAAVATAAPAVDAEDAASGSALVEEPPRALVRAEPAAGAEDGWLLHEEWVVVHSPLVFVREEPEDESRKLGYKWRGERVAVSGERGPWLKLALEEGWMLRDGSALGLGCRP